MYITLQIHRERKGDGKWIVRMILRSHLAWLLIPTQLCYGQIWWMSNALLETFCAGDPQPSQATRSHASPSESFSFCLTLLLHLKTLTLSYPKWAQRTHFPSSLALKDHPLVPPTPPSSAQSIFPQLFPLRLPGCQTGNTVVSWTVPSHLTAFWLHGAHEWRLLQVRSSQSPGEQDYFTSLGRSAPACTSQYIRWPFPQHIQSPHVLVSGPPYRLWEAAPWLLFPTNLCSSGFPAHVQAMDCLQVEVTCTSWILSWLFYIPFLCFVKVILNLILFSAFMQSADLTDRSST